MVMWGDKGGEASDVWLPKSISIFLNPDVFSVSFHFIHAFLFSLLPRACVLESRGLYCRVWGPVLSSLGSCILESQWC